MSATTVLGQVRDEQAWARAKRTIVIALATVVLFAVSFLIGRATAATSQHVVTTTPISAQLIGSGAQLSHADSAQVSGDVAQPSQANSASCRVGRPC
jgi:hypothetical protein